MKKLVLALLFIVSLSCVFALDGVILDVTGKAEKQTSNDQWIPINQGDILEPGDVISTGFKSEVVIGIGESTVVVKALTRMTVEQLYEKNDNHVSSMYIAMGSISADVKAIDNKRVGFTIKTPAVTASVRGTAGNVYAYGKVESVRGTWAIMPPQPQTISYDRGDAVQAVTTEEIVQETNESMSETDVQPVVQAETITEPVEETAVAISTTESELEIDTLLQNTTSEKEVQVSAGEIAQVSIENPGVIQTPIQVKETNAKTIAVAQTKLSDKENVSSSAPVNAQKYGKLELSFTFD